MFGSGRAVGIEVAGGRARIVLVAQRAVPVVLACREVLTADGAERTLPALVVRALNEMGVRRDNIQLAFSPPGAGSVRHLLFTAPKLKRSELQAVALRELRKDPLASPEDCYISVEALDTKELENGAKPQNYLLATLNHGVVTPLALALLEARFRVSSATTGALALVRTASLFEKAGQLTALAAIDRARSSLLVVEGGMPRFFREIAGSSRALVDDADALAMQALARELDISLVYFAQQNRPRQVESVFVAGEPALVEPVTGYLEERETYELPRLEAGVALQVADGVTAPLSTFAVAIGAALGPRTRSAPDLLPSELRGRPERLIALLAASVLIILATFGLLYLRRSAHAEQDLAQARHREAVDTFDRVKQEVDVESRREQLAEKASRWRTFFRGVDEHHRSLGRVIVGMATAMPSGARLSRLTFERAAKAPSGAAATGKESSHSARLEGLVRAPGLSVAQEELRRLVRALEQLPEVKQVELAPIRNPGGGGAEVEIAFSVDLKLYTPFPLVAP
jgi:hypothetical protein